MSTPQSLPPTPETTPRRPSHSMQPAPGTPVQRHRPLNALLTPPSSSSRPSHTAAATSRPPPRFNIARYFGPKRHRRILRDNLPAALNHPTIRRLARRGGIKRINKDIYPTVQQVVEIRLRDIISKVVELVNLADRKTVNTLDIVYALRILGTPMYGLGTIYKGDQIRSNAQYMRDRRAEQARAQRERDRERYEAEDRRRREERLDAVERAMRRGRR